MAADDPFRPDVTVLRPRPGAGKRTGVAAMTAPSMTAVVDDLPPSIAAVATPGLPPLIQAASPLLLLAAHLRSSGSLPDVGALRRQAMHEIRRFEARAAEGGVRGEVVLAARYVLCAGLDEAVLSTPWGAHSEWAQGTLLVTLHQEAWGGEKFFDLLQRLTADLERHRELAELQYLCVAFGFAGRFQVEAQGRAKLDALQHELYRRLRSGHEAPPLELSPRWRGVTNRRNPLVRFLPWWMAAIAATAILCVVFVVLQARLDRAAAPVLESLRTFRIPPAAAAPLRLKPMLAADEARGLLHVEEDGPRTMVTLGAGLLFGSANATVGDAQSAVLDRLAAALDRVPGSILVIGHADDRPLVSPRYRDNRALSEARAAAVAQLLARGVRDRDRITARGAGSSQPRYLPASDPANRARNRRVEIVHVAAS